MTFGVDPDTHIDSIEQAESATIEGTSKWSCKITITGIISSCHTRTYSSTSLSTLAHVQKQFIRNLFQKKTFVSNLENNNTNFLLTTTNLYILS
jgi:hypothetical protein